MTVSGKNVGFALTGSYCTFEESFLQLQKLVDEKANVYPIFSYQAQSTDSRFGNAADFLQKAEEITGRKPFTAIVDTEKIGQKNMLDLLIISPCTGNTLAKLAYGITDSPVLMAAKGTLRNGNPVVLAFATNDALGANLKNIGMLMNTKNIFFVPFGQDNNQAKPSSMVCHFDLILPTILEALHGKQFQPVIICPR